MDYTGSIKVLLEKHRKLRGQFPRSSTWRNFHLKWLYFQCFRSFWNWRVTNYAILYFLDIFFVVKGGLIWLHNLFFNNPYNKGLFLKVESPLKRSKFVVETSFEPNLSDFHLFNKMWCLIFIYGSLYSNLDCSSIHLTYLFVYFE